MKCCLQIVSWFNRKAKNFAIRLVKWTGKSKEFVHPKHLVNEEYHFWFTSFLKPEDVVIDLGCGNGCHSLVAARFVRSVKGIDHSEKNLKSATELAKIQGITNAQFKQSTLEQQINEPSNLYTVLFAFDVLEHLVNREQFLQEASRLLAPHGRLLLSVPNSDTSWNRLLKRHGLFYYSDLDHKHEYTAAELKKLIETHGYQVQYWDQVVYDTPWAGVIDMVGGISLSLYKRLLRWKREEALRYPAETTGFRVIAEKIT